MRLIDADALTDFLKRLLPGRGMWEIDGDAVKNAVCETVAEAIEMVKNMETIKPETNCSEFPNSSDCISRQAAIRIAEQGQVQGYEWQFKKLCELPSVQPKERCIANITLNEEDLEKIVKEQVEEIKDSLPRKGKWIEASEDWRNQITWWQCSECGTPSSIKSNFCPNCGSYNGGKNEA